MAFSCFLWHAWCVCVCVCAFSFSRLHSMLAWKLCHPGGLCSDSVPSIPDASVSTKQDACLCVCGDLSFTVTTFFFFASFHYVLDEHMALNDTQAERQAQFAGVSPLRGDSCHILY